MVLKTGKVIDKFSFSISGTVIPTITQQPVKSFFEFFDSAAMLKANKEVGVWLTKVDKSGLPGRFKAWIYKYAILPRVLWSLLVYEVPMKEDQWLSSEVAGPPMQSHQHCTVWDEKYPAAALQWLS